MFNHNDDADTFVLLWAYVDQYVPSWWRRAVGYRDDYVQEICVQSARRVEGGKACTCFV